ncbi:MAG: helicase-exonuclease AddAB subunit AddA [Defluviitaleaceae bacterium]|nr:helicase-exonuclease AddAB subunit AddA [Defluviitaleaceae bacterium]
MGINFTPAQQAAIDCDAPQILVSAAAGSGKTAVLTARVMRHLSQGIGLERLLVVTFTEAAAAGMKDKVAEQLSRQAALLTGADISTIHAFCRKLVKGYFQQVRLDPSFRVGDEAELDLIKAQVMDQLFEEMYREASDGEARGFLDLVDVYGGKAKDARLDALVRKLYDFLESDPFPLAAAQRYAAVYDAGELDATVWAAVAREELAAGLTGAMEGLERARALCLAPGGPEKYIERLERDGEMLRRLQNSLGGTFEEMYAAFGTVDWGRLPAVGKKDEVDADIKERAQRLRNARVKKTVEDLIKGVFFAPPGKMRDDIAALAPRVRALMALTCRFAQAYAEEKRARNLLDFSDLEHFAIQILYPGGPEDMTPGAVAAAMARKYHEVLIDEYQDANRVQELILCAVSGRRFMVGDVKQSIYRFRRANPELFREKYETYTRWAGTPTLAPPSRVRIDLSENFRSRAEVLAGVNFFFSRLMCNEVGEVAYDEAAALKPGKGYPPWPAGMAGKIQVDLLDEKTEEEPGDDPQPTAASLVNETRMIARRVHHLLENQQIWDESLSAYRFCRLSDMVVLTRSLTSIAPVIIEELKNQGIPATAEMGAAFFAQIEVKTALSFLRIVDNPRQDIDLITVLHSPVYGLDEAELYNLRQNREEGDFYDCVLAYASNDKNPLRHKLTRFLSDLARFRAAAGYLPVSRLLGLIYDTTRYPAHAAAMPGGTARLANLRLLLERAMAFEETRLTGLFHFTRYIQRLHETKSRVSAAPTEAAGENTLRLMTIHKSKGLEFPIVFVSFLGRKFNLEDERAPIILHGEKGLGANYVNTHLRTVSNTLPRFSLQRLTRRENLSEELRCLYVAMTRAMQCLILTARCADYEKESEKWAEGLSVYNRRAATRYLDWLMPCILSRPDAPAFDFRVEALGDIAASASPLHATEPPPFTAPAPPLIPTLQQEQALPSKLSISEIKRLYASDLTPDSTAGHDAMGTALQEAPYFDPPQFIRAQQGLTPLRMGSILHTLTEHMDYHRHTTPAALDGLIHALTEKNLLTPEEAAGIDRQKILTLAHSPLAERIRVAARLYREIPFVMAVPAGDIMPPAPPYSDDKILIHGIIDAYFEEDNQIVLIDFKSDHAASTDADALIARHKIQLDIYKKAVAQATAKEVKEVLLYSFALGRAIPVK